MLKSLSDSVRPVLTYFIVTLYVIAATVAAFNGSIRWDMWFAQIGTMAVSITSYWFGEKSALKNPNGEQNVN